MHTYEEQNTQGVNGNFGVEEGEPMCEPHLCVLMCLCACVCACAMGVGDGRRNDDAATRAKICVRKNAYRAATRRGASSIRKCASLKIIHSVILRASRRDDGCNEENAFIHPHTHTHRRVTHRRMSTRVPGKRRRRICASEQHTDAYVRVVDAMDDGKTSICICVCAALWST